MRRRKKRQQDISAAQKLVFSAGRSMSWPQSIRCQDYQQRSVDSADDNLVGIRRQGEGL